jgi:hypothetical protein
MNSQSNVIIPSGAAASSKWSIIAWLGSGAGFAAGWLLMHALPGKTKVQMIGGGLAGLVIGLVPYHVARRSGQPTLAANALMWTVLAGTIGGLLLAVPTALGFVVLAARRPAEHR